MPENQLDILIRTTADTSGAVETKKHLQGLTAGSADLTGTLKKLQENEVAAKVSSANLTASHGQLNKVLNQLPGPIREIGHALRAAFNNPIIGLALGLGLAIQFFANMLRKASEAIVKVDTGKSLARTMNEARDAVIGATNPWADYQRALDAARDSMSGVESQLRNHIEDIKEEAARVDMVTKAEWALAEAQLKARHERGQMTDEEFAKRMAHVESSKAGGETSRNQAEQEAILAAKRAAMKDAEGRSGGLSGAVYDATLDRTAKESLFKKATEDVEKYVEMNKKRPLTKEEIGALRTSQSTAAMAEGAVTEAKDLETRAKAAMEANTKAVENLEREIKRGETKLSKDKTSQNQADLLNQQAREFDASKLTTGDTARGLLGDAQSAAAKYRSGGVISPDERNAMTIAGSQISGMPLDAATAAKMFTPAGKGPVAEKQFNEQMVRFMESLMTALEKIHKDAAADKGSAKFENQLNDLERRLSQVRQIVDSSPH